MKSIWVIEQGSYSDYHVVGVFSTKKNAKLLVKSLTNEYETPTISEWPLDPGIEGLNKGYSCWLGEMLYDGSIEHMVPWELTGYNLNSTLTVWRRSTAPAYKDKDVPDCIHGTVLAKDRKHAIKIFNEKRVQLIASGEFKPPSI